MVFRMILNDLELVCALSSTSALIFYWYIDIVKPVTGLLRLLITIGFPKFFFPTDSSPKQPLH